MAKLKEIEIKWDANKIKREVFNKKIISYLTKSKREYTFKPASGFDYYYESETGRVARHRHGIDINELTIKARISNESTTIRHEANIKMTADMPVTEVERGLSLMGFNHSIAIYKDCDIYFVTDGKATIDIVWYIVSVPKSKYKVPHRAFFEIEVHGLPEEESLKMLNKWKKLVAEKVLILSDKEIVSESLYEIYSGKKYRLEKVGKRGSR